MKPPDEHWRFMAMMLNEIALEQDTARIQAEAAEMHQRFRQLDARIRLWGAGIVLTHGTGQHRRRARQKGRKR